MNSFNFKIILALLMLFIASVGGQEMQCKGNDLPPINIKFSDVEKDPNLKPLQFENYDIPVASAKVVNAGKTVIFPNDGVVRSISVNGDAYNLFEVQLHYWGRHHYVGTEHLLNSKAYDMEIHLAHQNSRGDFAIVGVLYKEAHHNNTGLNAIFEVLPQIQVKNETTQLRSPLNLEKLLPRLPLQFFRYIGKSTTPGLMMEITWSVAQDVLRIGSNQLKELQRLTSDSSNEDQAGCQGNNGPVQPVNQQNVTMST